MSLDDIASQYWRYFFDLNTFQENRLNTFPNGTHSLPLIIRPGGFDYLLGIFKF